MLIAPNYVYLCKCAVMPTPTTDVADGAGSDNASASTTSATSSLASAFASTNVHATTDSDSPSAVPMTRSVLQSVDASADNDLPCVDCVVGEPQSPLHIGFRDVREWLFTFPFPCSGPKHYAFTSNFCKNYKSAEKLKTANL